ncbi:MAG: hypothetical protein OXU20_21140 [Myxococcales bacterium]|nr:hypothetical protein [Myxococcales bacterium]MDD9965481.1 hypothetical protein [Myxococcales bacterium]
MSPVSSIAGSGLLHAQRRMARSAENVANVQTDGFEARREVGVDQLRGDQPAGVASCTVLTGRPSP